ncbi:protein ALP1-like [Xenia sp. Carnegie-2017]|uniref:protein ALP1-like n=1 Tax=Xenia sp. Carnegie-2017 TaxID=2897299 RepID=UPI001F0391D7|nr:protein ALP1-like [Xenia sp. Carnegie-2017]
MSPQIFDELLALVGPSLRRQDTQMRQSVGPAERLAITLRRLATGDSPQSIAFAYRRGASTVRAVVYDTCNALWRVLVPTYMKAPSQPSDWKKISEGFAYTWNFPNCIGALDGKHNAIQALRNSGSLYFNYKKHFSLVLMALCDSQYKFIFVDIGEAGRWSDGGVFANSQFGSAFLNGEMHLPADEPLPGTNESLPYTVVADEAFPLKTWMMQPYPGRVLDCLQKRVFNYRLSRARRTIENTFGIMVSKWRILKTTIICHVF